MAKSHQLAAIMFTDIVGYTALMGNDEQKAFDLLKKNRDIQKPIIAQFKGRWIKELGDGVMASFSAVSDAVHAAINIQQACNAGKEFQLRIGIHLGEVVFENEDVFGDGVNIASRIQAITNPGSIFISESVYHNVVNKKDFQVKYFKEQKLKNVKDPVKIYQVISDGVTTAHPVVVIKRIKTKNRIVIVLLTLLAVLSTFYFVKKDILHTRVPDEKSIAILPFTDLSPTKNQDWLSNGLADEIINAITIIKDIKVIGGASSFQFKEKGFDSQTIGEKLNVNLILEGSIQINGNVLRIITKLIRVKDNKTLWSQRFDKEPKDIFAIQDSISKNIVENLQITLSETDKPRLIKTETDPEVYSLYLKGLFTYKEGAFKESIEYNLLAIKKDSTYAPSYGYIALAKIWIINFKNSYADYNAIREAKEFALKTIRLAPNLAEGYSALALLAWSIELDFATAKQNFEKSIQLNPSASLIKNRYGYFLLWMGDFDKAYDLATDAIKSDPADFNGYVIAAQALTYKKKYGEAKKYIAEGKRLFPANSQFDNLDAQNIFYAGNYNLFIQLVKNSLQKNPAGVSDDLFSLFCIATCKNGPLDECKDLFLQFKNKPENSNADKNYYKARIYLQLGMRDSCFLHLEKSFDNRESSFRLFKIDPLFEPIRKDSRYRELYHRYGFDRYK